jgi:predicted DNA-binding transcriptional regulator AlpA
MSKSTANAETPRAWRVNDFCRLYGISRSTLYNMKNKDEIKLIKIGGRTLVPASEGERLLAEGC